MLHVWFKKWTFIWSIFWINSVVFFSLKGFHSQDFVRSVRSEKIVCQIKLFFGKLRMVLWKVSSKLSFLSKSFEKFVCSVKHNRFKVCSNHLDGFFYTFRFFIALNDPRLLSILCFFSDLHKHSQKMSSVLENAVCLQISSSINRAGHNWNYVYSLFQRKSSAILDLFAYFETWCMIRSARNSSKFLIGTGDGI